MANEKHASGSEDVATQKAYDRLMAARNDRSKAFQSLVHAQMELESADDELQVAEREYAVVIGLVVRHSRLP